MHLPATIIIKKINTSPLAKKIIEKVLGRPG
jgi:hypothetical protein